LWSIVINKKYKHELKDVKYEETRLHRACRVGRESSVNSLLRPKADVTVTNHKGSQPLSVASWQGRVNLDYEYFSEMQQCAGDE
jgi:ankyrin repeat protein